MEELLKMILLDTFLFSNNLFPEKMTVSSEIPSFSYLDGLVSNVLTEWDLVLILVNVYLARLIAPLAIWLRITLV